MTAPQTDAHKLKARLRAPSGGVAADTQIISAARSAADALDARDATIAALVESLELIRDWRKSCHEYDEDIGDDPREFDVDDLILMEWSARAALAKARTT